MRLETKFMLWVLSLVTTIWVALLVLRQFGLPASLLIVASMGFLSIGVAHYVLFRPIRQIVGSAHALGVGDFSHRLGFARGDEIGILARELDRMCERLQEAQVASEAHVAALEQLRHSDRLATIGRMASSVAHELGNPLNVIELRAQLITSGVAATLVHAQQNAAIIVEQTRRMTRIIQEILPFARSQQPCVTRLDLHNVTRKAIALCAYTSKKHSATIAFAASEAALELDGDPDKVLQIIVNLIINGVQAMPRGGTLNVSTCDELLPPIDDPEGTRLRYACVEVTDHGVGIAAADLSKVFEPFFSTKTSEGGTGLGLSVAQGIAREHSGWIAVKSTLGQGCTFRVLLPLVHGTPR